MRPNRSLTRYERELLSDLSEVAETMLGRWMRWAGYRMAKFRMRRFYGDRMYGVLQEALEDQKAVYTPLHMRSPEKLYDEIILARRDSWLEQEDRREYVVKEFMRMADEQVEPCNDPFEARDALRLAILPATPRYATVSLTYAQHYDHIEVRLPPPCPKHERDWLIRRQVDEQWGPPPWEGS